MSPKKSRALSEPVNVRLPEQLLNVLRAEAEKAERSLSQEIRWRLLRSVSSTGSMTVDETGADDRR